MLPMDQCRILKKYVERDKERPFQKLKKIICAKQPAFRFDHLVLNGYIQIKNAAYQGFSFCLANATGKIKDQCDIGHLAIALLLLQSTWVWIQSAFSLIKHNCPETATDRVLELEKARKHGSLFNENQYVKLFIKFVSSWSLLWLKWGTYLPSKTFI